MLLLLKCCSAVEASNNRFVVTFRQGMLSESGRWWEGHTSEDCHTSMHSCLVTFNLQHSQRRKRGASEQHELRELPCSNCLPVWRLMAVKIEKVDWTRP